MSPPRGQVERLRYTSQALTDNPLGDPIERDVWVWLPPDYAASGERYPVLWVLTGFTGRGRMALNDSPWAPGLDQRMDRLVAEGAPPAILVLPDCFTRYGGSQYVNSSATGRYEDYVIEELVPLIDQELRTRGAGHRGVLGKSSGGFAALRLAMRHPEVFAAAACHSGDMAFELCYGQDVPAAARTLRNCGGVADFLRTFDTREKKTSTQVHTLNILAMAACYSPNAEATCGFDLPFDLDDASRIDDVWARWLAHDPVLMLEDSAAREALDGLKALFIDCGTRDEYWLDFGARRFVKRLSSLDITHVYEEFDDDHRSISYRYDRSIPLLANALS